MKNKEKKVIQNKYVNDNINYYFNLLKENLYPKFHKKYIEEIKKLSQGFNIRLTREQKLIFCNKCNIYFTTKTREIRLNPTLKTKEYICKECGYTRRFKYK
jgi:RNase P subunit RPR2